MAENTRWLALGYSVPINPSKNRVYVWRKLKEYGAVYFKQGVALLPYTRGSYAKFQRLADKILEMEGEASIVELRFLDPKDEAETIGRFRSQEAEELNQLKEDCFDVLSQLSRQTSRALTELQRDQLKKLTQRYTKAKERSHFCGELADDVEHGLRSALELLRGGADDAAGQLARSLDQLLRDKKNDK